MHLYTEFNEFLGFGAYTKAELLVCFLGKSDSNLYVLPFITPNFLTLSGI